MMPIRTLSETKNQTFYYQDDLFLSFRHMDSSLPSVDRNDITVCMSFLLLYARQSETDNVEHYETTNHHNVYPSVSGLGTRTLSFLRYERHSSDRPPGLVRGIVQSMLRQERHNRNTIPHHD